LLNLDQGGAAYSKATCPE
jgi:hypothetical protein